MSIPQVRAQWRLSLHLLLACLLMIAGACSGESGSVADAFHDGRGTDTLTDASLDGLLGDSTGETGEDSREFSDLQDADSSDTSVPSSCEPNAAPFPVRPPVTTAATLPFLHVDGLEVVDDTGNPVALRGINFGSWLMMETWIAGIGEADEGDLLDQLRERASQLGVGALLQQAEDETALDWLLERRSHYPLVMEWRSFMSANASAEQAPAVEQLWDWFMSQPWVEEEESLWKWLQGRFGHALMEELRLAFQRSYITELDVERVANLGLNLIRVPIWYQSLETDNEGDVHFRAEGWEMLHQLALWARKHQVYLMLDLHGAPGGQSTSWHQGLADGGHLWERPECIARTARLWQALAQYFADDPHIAVYDLLNEPMNFPSVEEYAAVHDTLYQAVRSVDAHHIVLIEDGYRPFSQLRSPVEMGWENAMFSIHRYPGGDSAADYLVRIDKDIESMDSFYLDRFGCPLFMGEFSGADGTNSVQWASEGMDLVLERLNARGIHWAPWTWKYYAKPTWGLYHPINDPGTRIDVASASFSQLLEAFAALASEHFEADSAYEQVLMKNATAPPAPLFLGDWQGE